MNEDHKNRIKSSMIVYALEQSLGQYVIANENLSESIPDSVVENVKSRLTEGDPVSIVALVESSYLNEVFDFAIGVTKDTSSYEYMMKLKVYCQALDIFDIRNAVSHPNRPFPEAYWYRSAAIASDPLIDKLKLYLVKEALIAAVSGNLNEPPSEWINSAKWQIPNTLPITFDHEITGLLGRNKEFAELDKVLSKLRNNLIAVVAPGGIGKTSLILQFLRDKTLSPEWSKKIDSLVYCTLKNEILTTDGIETVEAIDGIQQVKESILEDLSSIYSDVEMSDFEDACFKLKDENILICIDNLETILMSSQEEFIDFNQNLPLQWRVIVTSRVSVDSATTVSLEPLGKRHGVNLARHYFKKKGVNSIEQAKLDKIAERANYNPLAIRLTVDTYLRGVDISRSIDKSQKNIALFSYRNLVDSLAQNSIYVLETTYAIGEATKTDFISLLELSSDQVVEAINELAKTSLLNRFSTEYGLDKYKLNESIKDLLLVNPKNISVRTKISKTLQKRKATIATQKAKDVQSGVNEFDEGYVAPQTEDYSKLIIYDLNKSLKYKNPSLKILQGINERFTEALLHQPDSSQLHYHYARLLTQFNNRAGAVRSLKKAKSFNDSPRVNLALATQYYYENDFETSISILESLNKSNLRLVDNSSEGFAFHLNNVYLNALLRSSQYKKVIKFTRNWKEEKNFRSLYATRRALAFKRLVEFEIDTDPVSCEEHLLKAVGVFDDLFKLEGYQYYPCSEAFKFCKQVVVILKQKNLKTSLSGKFKAFFLDFVANNFFEVVSADNKLSMDSSDSTELLGFLYELYDQKNPLHKVNWYKHNAQKVYDDEHIIELRNEGFTIVTISRIPLTDRMPNYLFAKDSSGKDYYLNIRSFDGDWVEWSRLERDDLVAIEYEPNNKGPRATSIVRIDQFEI